MRKLPWQMSVTLDGFMEGPNRELTNTAEFQDKDFDRYANEMLNRLTHDSFRAADVSTLCASYSATGPLLKG